MTKTAMIKERNNIWDEYIANRGVYESRMVEKARCEGFGMFVGTGEYEMDSVWIRDMTMLEWNEEKAKRYEYLKNELAEYEAEKAYRAKVNRYKKELEELKDRMAYLEKWLAENN